MNQWFLRLYKANKQTTTKTVYQFQIGTHNNWQLLGTRIENKLGTWVEYKI